MRLFAKELTRQSRVSHAMTTPAKRKGMERNRKGRKEIFALNLIPNSIRFALG
jgi:hypothetical protein